MVLSIHKCITSREFKLRLYHHFRNWVQAFSSPFSTKFTYGMDPRSISSRIRRNVPGFTYLSGDPIDLFWLLEIGLIVLLLCFFYLGLVNILCFFYLGLIVHLCFFYHCIIEFLFLIHLF